MLSTHSARHSLRGQAPAFREFLRDGCLFPISHLPSSEAVIDGARLMGETQACLPEALAASLLPSECLVRLIRYRNGPGAHGSAYVYTCGDNH